MLSENVKDEQLADIVLLNGKVITVDPKNSIAQAVALKGNKIILVGETKEIESTIGKKTEVFDLKGKAVLPGLMDAHVHFPGHGLRSQREFIIPSSSIKDVLNVIREKASQKPKGEWLIGGNIRFSHIRFAEKRWPTKLDLDEVAPDHLVFLHLGPHVKAVNSKVLELAKITKDTPDPLGGKIVKDPVTGEPTGVLRETASHFVTKLWAPYTDQDRIQAIRTDGQLALEKGCTTIHNIVTSKDELIPYLVLYEKGELPLRMRFYVRCWESKIDLDSILNLGLSSGFGNEWLKIAGLKMSLGGGISGSNAALYDEYSDEPGHFGVLRIPWKDLIYMLKKANEHGFQCAVHALGDRDLDMVINALEVAHKSVPPKKDLRHRVEHAGCWMFTPERRQRFRELGLIAVPNIVFIYEFGDGVRVTLGPERTTKDIFPFKSMLEEGMILVDGSDWNADPLRDIMHAVVRKTELGVEIDPSESISVMDAIRMKTINVAYAEFEENIKGSIEPGKLADLAVLEEDPLTIPPEKIKDITVYMTIIDGKIAYKA